MNKAKINGETAEALLEEARRKGIARRRGTKGPSNRYGNDRGEPTDDINYPYAKLFNPETLYQHASDHWRDVGMGGMSISEYERRAIAFANKVDSVLHDSFVDGNGTTYKYSYLTNEFIAIDFQGRIITYYCPDEGKEYWEGLKNDGK